MGQLLTGLSLILGIIANTISISQFVAERRRQKERIESAYPAGRHWSKQPIQSEPVQVRRNYFGCTFISLITFVVICAGYYSLDLDMDIGNGVVIGTALFLAGSLGLLVYRFSGKRKN